MTAPSSVSGDFKIGVQTGKGTPATTTYLCGRMKQSSLLPAFTELNPGAEHHCGSEDRPTIQKSKSVRTGYMASFAGGWFLYPDMLGVALRGLGMEVATTGAGTLKSHVFTIAPRDDAAWVSVIQAVGEGAARFEIRGSDGRVAKVSLASNLQGIVCAMEGLALNIADSVGTETQTEEVDALFTPSSGTFTGTVDGDAVFSGAPRMMMMEITNPMRVDEKRLFQAAYSDLPQVGFMATGALQGFDVTKDVWDHLYRGGSASGQPTLTIPQLALDFKFETPEDITGEVVPYSWRIQIPNAECRLTGYGLSGRELVRCGIQWNMRDTVAGQPITITGVNEKAAY